VLFLSIALMGVVLADDDDDDDDNRKCSIVGAYPMTEIFIQLDEQGISELDDEGNPITFDSACVFMFHKGGTFAANATVDNSLGTPTFPNGNYATVNMGIWKRIGPRQFEFIVTSVFSLKDTPPFTSGNVYTPIALYPGDVDGDGKNDDPISARVKLRGTFEFENDCRTLKSSDIC
jgi:hypothetical protein